MKQQATVVLLTVLSFEIILRVAGFPPSKENSYLIESKPQSLLQSSPLHGFELNPGLTNTSINGGPLWTATHPNSLQRFTEHKKDTLPLIDIYGCSFTYGFGIDDSSTYPFLLNNKLSNYQVKNLAIPGHGTIQTLQRLRQKQDWTETALIILNHSALLHDERNTLTNRQQTNWKFAFSGVDSISADANFPYLKSTNPNKIDFVPYNKLSSPWLVCRYSSIIHLVYTATKNNGSKSESSPQEASTSILQEIIDITSKHNTPLLITGITNDQKTDAQLQTLNTYTVDIAVDISKEQYNLMPHDGHPSAQAHKEYSEKVYNYLLQENIIPLPESPL